MAIKTLRKNMEQHPDATGAILSWLNEVEDANWDTPNELKAHYRHASIISGKRTAEAYEASLERIYELMQLELEPGTALGDELEVLTLLVQIFEQKAFPMPKPLPLDAIRFRMEQLGLSESELIRILGNRSRKSEILSGKRKLSLQMIRRISQELNISADVLIQAY